MYIYIYICIYIVTLYVNVSLLKFSRKKIFADSVTFALFHFVNSHIFPYK